MTVNELIEELRKYPADMRVFSIDSHTGEMSEPNTHIRKVWRSGTGQYGDPNQFFDVMDLEVVEIVGIW